MRIRAAREGDLPGLIELYRETVHAVGAAHYSRQELAAWAPDDLGPEDWAPRLARNTALVAEDGDALLGFAELSPEGAVEMLYVDKDHQGRGVATALLAALEARARDRGLARLTANASRIARPSFLARGFTLLAAQTVERRGVAIDKLVCLELNPQTHARLFHNLQRNYAGTFSAIQGAVGAAPGEMEVELGAGSICDTIVQGLHIANRRDPIDGIGSGTAEPTAADLRHALSYLP